MEQPLTSPSRDIPVVHISGTAPRIICRLDLMHVIHVDWSISNTMRLCRLCWLSHYRRQRAHKPESKSPSRLCESEHSPTTSGRTMICLLSSKREGLPHNCVNRIKASLHLGGRPFDQTISIIEYSTPFWQDEVCLVWKYWKLTPCKQGSHFFELTKFPDFSLTCPVLFPMFPIFFLTFCFFKTENLIYFGNNTQSI